jgi:hypothetical protein
MSSKMHGPALSGSGLEREIQCSCGGDGTPIRILRRLRYILMVADGNVCMLLL